MNNIKAEYLREVARPILNFYPAMDGVLHSVSEDKSKTVCGQSISQMTFVDGQYVRHKHKCCKICKP